MTFSPILIFCERRDQWKAGTQFQEFLRTLQIYYSNAYMDSEKQDAINVFLCHFQPQLGSPTLWELDSDQHYNIGRSGHSLVDDISRSFIRRLFSDGKFINNELCAALTSHNAGERAQPNSATNQKEDADDILDSQQESFCYENQLSFTRRTPSHGQLVTNHEFNYDNEVILDGSSCSNFFDFDWISSCATSVGDETERSSISSPIEVHSYENFITPITSSNPSATSIKAASVPPIREQMPSEFLAATENATVRSKHKILHKSMFYIGDGC